METTMVAVEDKRYDEDELVYLGQSTSIDASPRKRLIESREHTSQPAATVDVCGGLLGKMSDERKRKESRYAGIAVLHGRSSI